MDFFRAQDDARRRTRLLVGLFLLSLICLLAVANIILYLAFGQTPQQPGFYLATSAAILLIVLASSLFKSLSLRQGGEAVAQMLDARLLAQPSNVAEQRLLNVVEEMAIASGTPVPPVYVMEETAINAFAAGHSINDAVIGITRGAINKLNRDELQGVIAHEFSHVLHGDMRLNIRLIAWLHGIMVLSIIGHYVLRGASASRRDNNNAGIALFGLGLVVLGASGNFFGKLIKAAVSRQREYLADASAVQYTRNPQGIAGALKRIAADAASPVLTTPAATQISHALFSEGVHMRFNSLFATHPPLDKRIQAIDPQWDGTYERQQSEPADTAPPDAAQVPPQPLAAIAVAMALARAGAPDDVDVSNAQAIHGSLSPAITQTAHGPLGAAAIIALLLIREEPLTADRQQHEQALSQLQATAQISLNLMMEMERISAQVLQLEPQHRLPVVNICLGTLRQMSLTQYQQFRVTMTSIIAAQQTPALIGWILYELTIRHLDRAFAIAPVASTNVRNYLSQSVPELEIFLSFLSHCGHHSESEARAAFDAAATAVNIKGMQFSALENLNLSQFQHTVAQLSRLADADKKRLLDAVSICVCHDDKLTVIESELLRMSSEMLGWPLPAKIFR